MASITLGLARPEDNRELLDLLDVMPMPGSIQVVYQRRPDFFAALAVEGRERQTIVGRDRATGMIAGMGTRTIKPAYVNGQPAPVGYLGGLRVKPTHRGTIHLARGYQLFRKLHDDGKARFYLSTILNDNEAAQKLTGGRGKLPAYRDFGQVRSAAIATRTCPHMPAIPAGLQVRAARPEDIPAMVQFLNREGARRQFFPIYRDTDFTSRDGLLRGLQPSDIRLAYRDGALVGTTAAWDQQAYRQSIVTGYARWLSLGRPLCNLLAAVRRLPNLPAPGNVLDCATLSMVCVQNDDTDTFRTLLRSLLHDLRHRHGFIMAGLHERDPLLPVLEELPHVPYRSRLYLVHWEDAEDAVASIDGRTPYLEIGGL